MRRYIKQPVVIVNQLALTRSSTDTQCSTKLVLIFRWFRADSIVYPHTALYFSERHTFWWDCGEISDLSEPNREAISTPPQCGSTPARSHSNSTPSLSDSLLTCKLLCKGVFVNWAAIVQKAVVKCIFLYYTSLLFLLFYYTVHKKALYFNFLK